MNRDEFVRQNEPAWNTIEELIERLDSRQKYSHDLAELPELYRRCCHHLALSRQRRYDHAVEARLNRIAVRGYRHLYRQRGGSLDAVWHFLAVGFPRLVRAHAAYFWLATVLFYGPGLAMGLMVLAEPDTVYALLDAEQVRQFEAMYQAAPDSPRGAAADWTAFGYYVLNNVSIAFRTFASGLVAGLGTLFFLTMNGLYLGAVFGHLVHAGSATNLLSFVITHGAFELTALVISGVAGLRLGAAVVLPGRYTRLAALRRAAPVCARLIAGVAVMLVVAALLEAFWSATTHAPPVKIAVGSLAWCAVAGGLLLGGRGSEP